MRNTPPRCASETTSSPCFSPLRGLRGCATRTSWQRTASPATRFSPLRGLRGCATNTLSLPGAIRERFSPLRGFRGCATREYGGPDEGDIDEFQSLRGLGGCATHQDLPQSLAHYGSFQSPMGIKGLRNLLAPDLGHWMAYSHNEFQSPSGIKGLRNAIRAASCTAT